MKSVLKYCTLLLAFTLVGCTISPPSVIQNRDAAYMNAKNEPPIRIPPGLTTNEFHNYYPISDRTYPEGTKAVSLIPPGLNS